MRGGGRTKKTLFALFARAHITAQRERGMLPRLLVFVLAAAAAAEAASQFRARQRRRMPATTSTSEQRLSSSGLPLPTPEQLAWQKGEIMALIHFNMATFFQVSLEATYGMPSRAHSQAT